MKKSVIRPLLATTSLHLIALAAMLLAGATSATAQNYPPVRTDIQLDETLLPILFINTLGQEINRDEHISAEMTIVWNDGGLNYSDTLAHPGQHIDYRGHIGIRYRGNSSFSYSAKKPYSIKLLTDSYENGGKKQKASLLGMGEDEDWALLAPYNDRSMIRNTLSMTLAEGYLVFIKTRQLIF